MSPIINLFQQSFYQTVSSDGIQDFIGVFTARPGYIFLHLDLEIIIQYIFKKKERNLLCQLNIIIQ